MNKHRFYNLVTASFFLVSSNLSFAGGADSTFPVKTNTISTIVPADFKPEQHILLIAEMPRRRNDNERNKFVTKRLDKALKESYPYKYEIVSHAEIMNNNIKYSDTSIYKYALLNHRKFFTSYKPVTRNSNGSLSGGTSVTTTYIDFFFYERTTGSKYQLTGNSSPHIGRVVKAFSTLVKKENEKTARN